VWKIRSGFTLSALIFSTAWIAVSRVCGFAALSKPICVSLIWRKVKGLGPSPAVAGVASALSRSIEEAMPPLSV